MCVSSIDSTLMPGTVLGADLFPFKENERGIFQKGKNDVGNLEW